ncbi:hypothetical protein MNBD_ALPHA06-1220 [hydrothermal vent metagenome]|uniref:Glycosyltransferase 2-like domain-containing protein n=1 Tax=hydrothermal vent metagenome TaxID=652676 RepID=A0A3B0RA63_9ZZZZ
MSNARPILSVLIPYFGDDPSQLIAALDAQQVSQTEIILYDDGSEKPDITARVQASATSAKLPVQNIIASQNKGRSAARNCLVDAAKGQYLLFLDADMLPEDETFLQIYLDLIKSTRPAIVFGGFSVLPTTVDRSTDLHRALSAGSDCLDAKTRKLVPAKHVCSSNLLVRDDVLRDCPFDTDFVGWGWEDVEWAARAFEQFAITHIDNPAVHLGLESAETLVRRYRDSAANYAKFVARHPQLAKQLPSYRTAKLAGRIPGLKLLRPVLASLVRDPWHLVPMKLRIFALKLWRAGWYAEALT